MTEPSTVFKLRSLDTDKPSKYLLSVFMPVPFGMGKNVFQVDSLHQDGDVLCGCREDPANTVVVRFPNTFQYLLINRDQYETISMDEAKKMMAETDEPPEETVEEPATNPVKKGYL